MGRRRGVEDLRDTTTEQGFVWTRRGDTWRVSAPNGGLLFAPVRIRERRGLDNLRSKLRRAGASL